MLENSAKILGIIRSSREILLPRYGSAGETQEKDDGPHDIVTELDHKIEALFSEEFAKIEPTITFVGEESGGDRSAERFWLVDPIDGTGSFVRGMPFCTTMVALIEDGQVVFGAIYDFLNDVMYHAEKGKGSYANGEPIRVSDRPFRKAKLFFETDLRVEVNALRYHALRKDAVLLYTGSSGFEHVLVAAGKMDGRIVFDGYGKDYDFAAGSLLVAEAGGIVRNIGSDSYDYTNTNFIAANPHVYEALTSEKFVSLFQ